MIRPIGLNEAAPGSRWLAAKGDPHGKRHEDPLRDPSDHPSLGLRGYNTLTGGTGGRVAGKVSAD